MKKLNYYESNEPLMVGFYEPSEPWNKYTHFAVMGEKTQGLEASVGYFLERQSENPWDLVDYTHAAACIEQAQLYSHAPALFYLIQKVIENPSCPDTALEVKQLIEKITNIEESVKRLLGEDAMADIMGEKYAAQKGYPKVIQGVEELKSNNK